ncbi:FecR family protein [Flavilitoribacter nigricans]|nr:FecR domain-containing protein [Flavilitoribacter nigricans]
MEWVAESDANQAFFDEMIHLWGLTGDADRPFQADTKAAWNKVSARIGPAPAREEPEAQSPGAKIRPLSIKRDFLRIAAVLLPLIAVAAWILLQPNEPVERLIVSTDTTKEIVLPDSSRVTLNANSQLSYFEDFTDRKVRLTGEAFFDVARDTARPFEIFTGETVTRVLGTSFNVRAFPEEDKVEVMVVSGTVEFKEAKDESDRIVLNADEGAVFSKEAQKVEAATSLGNNANAWMKNEIDAVDIPLREMLQIINNYFRTEISAENEAALTCNVSIPKLKDPTLDKALEFLTEQLYLEKDTTGNRIILTGKGCNN